MRLSIINFLIMVIFISSCAPKPGTPESKLYLQKEKSKLNLKKLIRQFPKFLIGVSI